MTRARREPMRAPVRIGTSGWQYRHWAGTFYPRGLPLERWLDRYVEEFDTVELNNPFYRLPEGSVFARWGRRVPADFRFAVKASRYLTHVKRLREPQEPLERFWTRARRMGERLGPVLYQLPPRWNPNHGRLRDFVAELPDHPQAVEFRERAWYSDGTFALLSAADVALCLHDMAGSATKPEPVGPFVYLRFHGSGQRYGGRYPSQRLAAWADRIARWTDANLPVWAYFNNDVGGHAFRDADRLRAMVHRRIR